MAEPLVIQRRPAATQAVEETAIATRTESSGELAPTSASAAVQHEIQGAIILARRFPRNEDNAYQALLKSCQRTSFAEDASYSFPRGGQTVEGPSVKLAREAARVWGNIRYGLTILRDDDESRDVEGWAWDIQTNAKVTAGDSFRKLIQRKGKNGGPTTWVVPDERDLRELTNRRGAILVRNCILQLMPSDFIEDAREQAKKTLRSNAEQDPDGERKKAVVAFGSLNITPEMLEAYLGHPLAQSSPAEIADLREVYASIRDGNSTWSEYVERERKEPEKGNLDLGGVKGKEIPARDEKRPEPPEPAAAEIEKVRQYAAEKNVGEIVLDTLCREKCDGRGLAELTADDCRRMVLELGKIKVRK